MRTTSANHDWASARATRLGALALGLLLVAPAISLGKPGNGKAKGQSPDFVPPGQVDRAVPPGQRRAPTEVVVLKAPPPIRVETVPIRPFPTAVWVPGYWQWEPDAYVWVSGAWMAPPEPEAVWVAPRYEMRSGVHIFVSGYWKL